MGAIFGPAGNAENFPYKSSADAPKWLKEIGLDCYEYQCGKGVHVGEATARKVGAAAAEQGISLSLHAPYFINLANPDPDALQKTIGYITGACRVAEWMGAARVVIHSFSHFGASAEDLYGKLSAFPAGPKIALTPSPPFPTAAGRATPRRTADTAPDCPPAGWAPPGWWTPPPGFRPRHR